MAPEDGTEERDAAVIVWRYTVEGRDYLVLHRRGAPPEGDGAWSMPAGSCDDHRKLRDCAAEALHAQTGLVLALSPVEAPVEFPVFSARADADAVVSLGPDYDDHAWVSVDDALARCRPARVAETYRAVDRWIDAG